jgi:hypothetical protein
MPVATRPGRGRNCVALPSEASREPLTEVQLIALLATLRTQRAPERLRARVAVMANQLRPGQAGTTARTREAARTDWAARSARSWAVPGY